METNITDTSPELTNGDLTVSGSQLIYYGKKISLSDVTAIRFGWLPLRLYHFSIGSRWMLVLKTHDQEIKIHFPSYFGMFKNRQYENFNSLLNVIWDATVVRLLNAMIDDLNNSKTITIGKCTVSKNGIALKNFFIEWDDLLYQKNYNRLTINSRSNTSIWTNLQYTETDNVQVLMSFLEWKFENAGAS